MHQIIQFKKYIQMVFYIQPAKNYIWIIEAPKEYDISMW